MNNRIKDNETFKRFFDGSDLGLESPPHGHYYENVLLKACYCLLC